MSLNRSEQALYDYITKHPDERHYIHRKVQSIGSADEPAKAVAKIDTELWRYYEERSAVVPIFKEAARAYGMKRISMKNLAEFLLRTWVNPKPKAAPQPGTTPDSPKNNV
jgi:hypothetical protein